MEYLLEPRADWLKLTAEVTTAIQQAAKALVRALLVTILVTITPVSAQIELSNTIERIKPGIVLIGAHSKTGAPPFIVLGTGFAIQSNLVATNAHVTTALRSTPPGSAITIQSLEQGGKGLLRTAKIVGMDTVHDLAILHVDGPPLRELILGNSDSVKEGASVAFIGFPIGGALGYAPVTHRGIVSAITNISPPGQRSEELNARRVQAIRAGSFQIFQLDATAYPGNSGGPLFDPQTGNVLGIINMVFVKGSKESALTSPSGISYAIPVRHLIELKAKMSEVFTDGDTPRHK